MLVDGALAKCRTEGYYLRGMAGEGSGYGQTPTAIPTANLATVRANNEPSRQSGQAIQVWLMHVEQWETGGSLGLSSRGGRDSRDKHQKEWLSLLSSDLSGFFFAWARSGISFFFLPSRFA